MSKFVILSIFAVLCVAMVLGQERRLQQQREQQNLQPEDDQRRSRRNTEGENQGVKQGQNQGENQRDKRSDDGPDLLGISLLPIDIQMASDSSEKEPEKEIRECCRCPYK